MTWNNIFWWTIGLIIGATIGTVSTYVHYSTEIEEYHHLVRGINALSAALIECVDTSNASESILEKSFQYPYEEEEGS